MKTTLLLLLFPLLAQAQIVSRNLQVVNTIADLKAKPVDSTAVVLVQGKTTMADGNGAFYRWSTSNTDAEDMTFLNVVVSTLNATGRWVRLNVRTVQLPHGILTMNGGVKTFFASGTTNASAEYTVNLTYDGTATGTAIFSKLLFKETNATNAITAPNDFIWGGFKAATADIKQVTFKYIKGSAPVSATLGLLINPVANAPTSTPVECRIEGQ